MRCVLILPVHGMDTLIWFSGNAAGGLEFSDFPVPDTEYFFLFENKLGIKLCTLLRMCEMREKCPRIRIFVTPAIFG